MAKPPETLGQATVDLLDSELIYSDWDLIYYSSQITEIIK
eukprot:CAMPEP_0201285888 /NCGR_PEP_ID=MMETSP1317-20130820/113972_1 /ASSEMBLY_ACC=CAM_ASM_000770 /TAXON_ID=187299 /ORGANISM="Undescribed Undescribed, Strain Undescribed" /LENGTH=39 /DNA_ID= /DNA_START= /DNA_END= /DNA_ORIENTATION=